MELCFRGMCVCVYACAHVWCTEKGYGLVYHGEKYLKSIDLNDFFKIVFLTLQSSRKGAWNGYKIEGPPSLIKKAFFVVCVGGTS